MITFAHVKGPTWQYSISDGYYLYLTYRRIVLSLFEAIWIEMDLCFLSHSILGIFQEHVKVSLVSLQQWWKCCLHVFLRYMLHSPCPGMLGAWKDWCQVCVKSSVFPMLDVCRSCRNNASSWRNQSFGFYCGHHRLSCLINGYKCEIYSFGQWWVYPESEGLSRPRFKDLRMFHFQFVLLLLPTIPPDDCGCWYEGFGRALRWGSVAITGCFQLQLGWFDAQPRLKLLSF